MPAPSRAGYAAGFGEIISGSRRNDAQAGRTVGAHDAVDSLVNTAIAAGHNDPFGAEVDLLAHLLFEIAHSRTCVPLVIHAGVVEQLARFGASGVRIGLGQPSD